MSDKRSVNDILNEWDDTPQVGSILEDQIPTTGLEEAKNNDPSKEAFHAKVEPILKKHGFKRSGNEYTMDTKVSSTTIRLYFESDSNDSDSIVGDMSLRLEGWTGDAPLIGSTIPLKNLDRVLQNCDGFVQAAITLEKEYKKTMKFHDKVESLVD